MSQSPDIGADGLVTFTISSEGSPIKDSFGLVSIKVRKEANRIGWTELVISAGDMPAQDIPESDDETFAPGKVISIEAGYANTNTVIFEGMVTGHNIEINAEGATLRVDCRDYAFQMTRFRNNRVFEESTDSEAIDTITGEYGKLSTTIDSTAAKYNTIVQYYSTDWDFILSKADANGLIVITEGKEMKIIKPKVTASAVLKVTYGNDMMAFNGELNAAYQPSGATAVAWDVNKQAIITSDGAIPTLNSQGDTTPAQLASAIENKKMTLQSTIVPDKATLQAWADAQMLKTGMSRIRGEVKFQGSALAVVGSIIDLAGLGKRFNGDAFVGSVLHEIEDGNWTTTVGMGLSHLNMTDNPDVSAAPASGLLPGIQGLQIGKVVKIDEDPDKENKIQVEIPLLHGEKNNVWARLASFWASSTYGAFFIPDVGDEVVLGFFNDNPCNAVVLGSLYSSTIAPSSAITKENFTRSIVTKSKLTMKFDEDKKVITFETPGKNIIEINDDQKSIKLTDQNSNKIVMSDSGITIESAQSLTLKAKTDVEISAGSNVSIKAGANVNLKGVNVEASADMAFTAKGNAQAELSASGQVTVKGAIVMIN
ncbi:type VI secretion system tip protein VgrG [Flavobacterium hauense]